MIEWADVPHGVAAGSLDLYDVGTEVGQELGAEDALLVGKVEDTVRPQQ